MDLIEQLEALRIPDSIFGDSDEQQHICAGKNEMLDNCLEIVWKWIQENHLTSS